MQSTLKAVLSITVLLAAACGSSSSPEDTAATAEPTATPAPSGVVTVPQLLAGPEGQVVVGGAVIWDAISARLCEELLESFPPQCGGASVVITNPDALNVTLESEGEIRWTQGFVEIEGNYDDQQLTINP